MRNSSKSGDESTGLFFARPDDIIPNKYTIRDMLSTPHSPGTIKELDGVEYDVGFVRVSRLLEQVGKSDIHYYYELLRHIGGCTTFNLGSDNLSPEKLSEISEDLTQYLAENDMNFLNIAGSLPQTNQNIILNNLKLPNIPKIPL